MAFSLKFEAQREPVEGVAGIRYVMIPPTRFFGPIVVYGCLLADGAVELVSLIHDEGYGKLIDEDPVD